MTKLTRNIYRTARALLFAAILTVAALYILAYVLVAMPAVQERAVRIASKELSGLVGSRVEIGSMEIFPFNELRLHDVRIFEPDTNHVKQPCLSVKTLGAGIELFELFKGRLVFSYAGITDAQIRITKATENSPYNIAFLIEAFKSKEQKEPKNFSMKLRTVALRNLSVSYDLLWKTKQGNRFDPTHMKLTNLRADVALPRLETVPLDLEVRLRRLAFVLDDRFVVDDLGFVGKLSDKELNLHDFHLGLEKSDLRLGDISLKYESLVKLPDALRSQFHGFKLYGDIVPSDLSLFLPELEGMSWLCNLNISGETDLTRIRDININVRSDELKFVLDAEGSVSQLNKPKNLAGDISIGKLQISPEMSSLVRKYVPVRNPRLQHLIAVVGNPSLTLSGNVSRTDPGSPVSFNLDGELLSDAGDLEIKCEGALDAGMKTSGLNNTGLRGDLRAQILSSGIKAGELSGTEKIGNVCFEIETDLRIERNNIEGTVNAVFPVIETARGAVENLSLNASKQSSHITIESEAHSDVLAFDLAGDLELAGENSVFKIDTDIRSLPADLLGLKGNLRGAVLKGNISGGVMGNNEDNLQGSIVGDGIGLVDRNGKEYILDNLRLDLDHDNSGLRQINLTSDLVDASVGGRFRFAALIKNLKTLVSGLLPAVNPLSSGQTLLSVAGYPTPGAENLDLGVTVRPLGDWADFFNLPVRPLSDMTVEANVDFIENKARLDVNAPYLRQGKNKLIQNTHLSADLLSSSILDVEFSSLMPAKKQDMAVKADIGVRGDDANLSLEINPDRQSSFSGKFGMTAKTMKLTTPEILINLLASSFNLTGEAWRVDNGTLLIHDKKVSAQNLTIAHKNQFLKIDGTASADPEDVMTVQLSDIDLSYIFDILNISYVNFGGFATGKVRASELFSKKPAIFTDSLTARKFSYSGAVLGDAALKGVFHTEEKRIEIGADIREGKERRALAEGNIWLGRDSLSFNFDANRLNAGFIGQFMSSFASEIEATASGNCRLFGTFKNIDLRGRLHADTISLRLGYTGVKYGGSDSVFLEKGRVRIPSFTLYDKDGHSGAFSGELRHNYLHDMSFDFRLNHARRLLCYDLPKTADDVWWGTVYASGNASVHGVSGQVDINVDVTSEPESSFYFSLSDSKAAAEYSFLTFTDITPKEIVVNEAAIPDFAEMLKKKISQEDESSTDVHIDLRLNVTPSLNMTMIMDPVSGDKITARGYGPMQIQYETENDEPRMYGKYTIIEGLYNFSLQDVILRDFQIRDGSTISFNGDPLAAILDIRAAYRVNTSLTDLDKSFAFDRDLNRTNVPVDAMLVVSGPLDAPDIDFDLEFPTMTEEVSRKVKSIVSTNDLMSRQIIYLLALNRFYTPEYMDTSGTGGELASVASSTISSQLGNALSQLTDKLSVMPSFRSDKGDFSDLEMDLGLSSRLLNNRLLINGNFGYRDRTTSTTTFVGDFDVQYLLTRRGNLILKAYNHFNDQNYYLRQALTTQGIGLEYRHDFNRFLSFLRSGKKRSAETLSKKEEAMGNQADSLRSTIENNEIK